MGEDRLRICLISEHFAPDVGGAESRAEKQARQLQALGHDVIVVTQRLHKQWKRTEILDGLQVIRAGGVYRRGGQLRSGRLGIWPITIHMFFVLWRLRHQFDVLHALQLSPLAAAAALIGRLTHKPVVISVQSTGYGETQVAGRKQGATLMADTLTTTSFLHVDTKDVMKGDIADLVQRTVGGSAVLSFIRRSGAYYQVLGSRGYPHLTAHGFPAPHIIHIPGSVDIQKFRPAPERQTDPTRPERDLICVARLDYAKGVDVLLHAWGRLMHAPAEWRAHLKPRMRLVGDGVHRAQLERIAAELGIEDSVEFLGQRSDIVDLLQGSWGFVLPSRCEGMPNALLEAMACAVPCIATRVSGSEDIISDGINGLLVEPEQPAEMARALRRIIEDCDLARYLGQEGCVTVVREYQLARIVGQCLDLYRRLRQSDNAEDGEATPDQLAISLKGRSE